MKNILIVTGGSGGHVVPSTSLFEHLKKKFSVKMVSDLRGSKYINTEKFNVKAPKILITSAKKTAEMIYKSIKNKNEIVYVRNSTTAVKNKLLQETVDKQGKQ